MYGPAETAQYSIFETALGWFGIVWTDLGISRCRLPGEDPATLERQLLKARDGQATVEAVPGVLPDVERRIVAYASGETVDFATTRVDLSSIDDPARLRLYTALRSLGYGETITYGELGHEVGLTGQARLVGQAMGANPLPLIIPCHRVVAAGGRSGGFSAPGGATSKMRMLALERARPRNAAQASFVF